MSSKAAAAMYPNLVKPDEDQRQHKLTEWEGKPAWARTDGPLWSEPRPVIRDYSKVPGLIRKR
jgi:hypothetical protein